MKLILNESLISNKDSDIIEDTTIAKKPDYQIIDITVIPDETYYPTIQSILIDLDESNKLKESENSKLDINILSETVNQKTGYSNSLFEFESSNHTITLSLVLQETDRRGIYKVEAYTTRGIKVFESNTYRPKYVIESYLNSLANEYLIDKPLKESDDNSKEEFRKFAEKMKRLGFLDIKDMSSLSDDGFVDKLSFSDLNMFNKLENVSYKDIQNMVRKALKESAPYYIGPNEYALIKSNDEDSDVLCMYLDDNCYDEEVIPKNWTEDKIRMLAGKISKSEGPRGNRDFISEVEKEYQAVHANKNLGEAEEVPVRDDIEYIYPGQEAKKEMLEKYLTKEQLENYYGALADWKRFHAKYAIGYTKKLEDEAWHKAYMDEKYSVKKEAEDPVKDDVKEDLGIEPGSDEEATLDEIYEEPEKPYEGLVDDYKSEDPAPNSDPDDYSVEEFMTALRLADEVYDLNIDYSKWNDASQEERFELVKPEISRFLAKHKNEFDKSPKLFDLLQYDLIDANFHTEAKVLKDLYRGGK
jgi:hypothetical protein